MKVLKLSKENEKEILENLTLALNQGKVLALPTDTVYGLVAKADDEEAVRKIFVLKKRSFQKPIGVFVESLDRAKNLAFIDKEQEEFIKKHWPGAFTFIFKAKVDFPLIVKDGKIGLRMPEDDFLLSLISKVGFPLAQTSANISGKPPALSAKEVLDYFDDNPLLKIVVERDVSLSGKPSKVLDLTYSPYRIVR